jgi:hypothetical protein
VRAEKLREIEAAHTWRAWVPSLVAAGIRAHGRLACDELLSGLMFLMNGTIGDYPGYYGVRDERRAPMEVEHHNKTYYDSMVGRNN